MKVELNLSGLINNLQVGSEELSKITAIFTAERGYRNTKFMNEISNFGYCSILIMPGNLLPFHPFVSLSYLDGV